MECESCLQCQQMIRFDEILGLLFIVSNNGFFNACFFVCSLGLIEFPIVFVCYCSI